MVAEYNQSLDREVSEPVPGWWFDGFLQRHTLCLSRLNHKSKLEGKEISFEERQDFYWAKMHFTHERFSRDFNPEDKKRWKRKHNAAKNMHEQLGHCDGYVQRYK
jgi:hypothetical protein